MTVIVCAMHLLAAEYIPAERSKGDILRFRRTSHLWRAADDSEAHSRTRFAQDINKQDGSCKQEKTEPEQSVTDIQRQSSVFHWRGLSYDIKLGSGGAKRILDNIDGWVKPGTITALMASGIPKVHQRVSNDFLGRDWCWKDNAP